VHCVLIYNPASGRERFRRAGQIQEVSDLLSALGHRVDVMATTAPGSATLQARDAAANGANILFACGGDGTVHEVIQGLVSETVPARTILGILPFGSANALARNLQISLDPTIAVRQLIQGRVHTIPVGKLVHGADVRYFAVMAGAGPDGALAYEVLGAHKSNLGRLAYYLHSARLFFTRRFRPFEVEYTLTASGNVETRRAVSVMAVRLGDLGGLFGRLTDSQASADDTHLRLLILGPPAAISLPLWFLSGWLNLHSLNPFLRFADVSGFHCGCGLEAAPHIQADGEWIGHAPMQVSLVPNALRLLVPSQDQGS
jgi:diacylglycerol kinase (ATP)